MKEVFIDGEIGYCFWDGSGVTAKSVESQLGGIADDEDITITVNSPGGSVYEGIVIFNLIRDYAKTHPVTVRINCMAMSMASYIALAARTVNKNSKIIASENSLFMIHNPHAFTKGDYRQLKKDADYLEKLAAVYGSVHAAVSGKSETEIRAAMDEGTYYVGREIQDAGFANDWEEITGEKNEGLDEMAASARDSLIISAKLAFDRTMEKARDAKEKNAAAYRDGLQKAAALYQTTQKPPAEPLAEPRPEEGGAIETRGGFMKPEELLAQDKGCYEAVFALGEKAALEKERSRIAAHIRLGEKTNAMDIAMKHIRGGASVTDEAVNDEYLEAAMDRKRIDARNADDPPPVNTGSDDGGGMDDEKIAAAFEHGLKGRDAGGKSWTE
jgi:ATP-dependent protease ClpP protease subunit